MNWEAGNKLKTFVYNRDFVNRNFNTDKELKGIFTLGEDEGRAIKYIEDARMERDGIVAKITGKKKTLGGEDGNGGKRAE